MGLMLTAGAMAAAVLIVPSRPVKREYSDQGGSLLEMIANYFDEDGRVSPIAWTPTDRIFRTAMDNRQVPNVDYPSEDMAKQAATVLRCDYIMYVSVWREKGEMFAKARLVHKGKETWIDPKPDPKFIESMRQNAKNDPEKKPFDEERYHYRIMNVELARQDGTFDTLRTLARTWTDQMFVGPLKNYQPRPRIGAAPPEGGIPPVPPPPPVNNVDNKDLLTKVMAMMAKGDSAGAINAMRDAVDTAPLDFERRRVLVEVLTSAGFYAEAAKQARRAATILPNPTEMYVLAAKAWLAADKPAEAQQDLKEAVSREPETPSVRALLAEVSLRDGKYDDAVKHFSFAIGKSEESGLLFQRALAYALSGEGVKARADLERCKQLGLTPLVIEQKNLYPAAINMVSVAAIRNGTDFRDLVQKIKLKPYESAWPEEVDAIRMRCDALQLFLRELTPPSRHNPSHGERALGVKMILEAITMIESFLKQSDEDVMSEAHISLGEGLRRLLDARELYVKELPG